MEGQVTDFFNEIDSIVPKKVTTPEWQECYDEKSGYTYYWNINTDKVSWEKPADYKEKSNRTTKAPLRSAPLFPSVAPLIEKQKVQESQDGSIPKRSKMISNDADEKRTIVLTPYNNSSDSDNEIETRTVTKVKKDHEKLGPTKTIVNSPNSSNSDKEEEILLNKIQDRAKLLTKLGGELPTSVKKIVEHNGCNVLPAEDHTKKQTRKDVTGFSLVAGYSDSSDEEDTKVPVPIFRKENEASVGTLFPIAKPIDVTQFTETKQELPEVPLDAKAFQRKKRININYLDSISKSKVETSADDERLGFGFIKNEEDTNKTEVNTNYAGFKSAGLMFVSSDTVEPAKKSKQLRSKQKSDKKYSADELKKIEDAHKNVSEKLNFLAEGHALATPVQTMIIQLETLYDAMKANSLSINYLQKWLQDTYTELAKLEKGAAPAGWSLKWDRIVKRYYYRNHQTGDCQWHFPQDIIGCDEAMDISTTPPPPPVVEDALPPPPPPEPTTKAGFSTRPPPPPRIKSPTPPPPPSISLGKQKVKRQCLTPKKTSPPEEVYQNNDEPLPPGVDLPSSEAQPAILPPLPEDPLGSALTSFYSDLASMEYVASTPLPPLYPSIPVAPNLAPLSPVPEKAVKKKKEKVKIVEGLAMKKKGVSKLVEKWKNVQKDY